MQILIVEDDVRLARALAHILEENGYGTDVVHNGADGLAYAESEIYDVVILDVMLPKMDGFTVVAELRRKNVSTPVLLLTARDAVPDKITGLDTQGKKVFSHTYRKLDKENENGFIFYQSEDENSGEFTYFAFSPDTMATTYHLEFRYAEDLDDLQSWFEGDYAYWNASAITEDYDQETLKNVITLFVTENLSESK